VKVLMSGRRLAPLGFFRYERTKYREDRKAVVSCQCSVINTGAFPAILLGVSEN
jgi:hypothetical protein